MNFDTTVGIDCRTGRRARNEDFAGALADDPGGDLVVAVADGVSAGGGGREAAQTTVMTLLQDVPACPAHWDPSVALDRVLQAHNGWLWSQNRRLASEGREMATTLTALVLRGQTWTAAHVGDSRAWMLRDGSLRRLTTDHVRSAGDLRAMLTRAVGIDERVLVDFYQGELAVGDRLVLATDGVWSTLDEAAIARIVAAEPDPREAARRLCDRAAEAGSDDNLTAAVVHVAELPAADLRAESLRAQSLPVPRRLAVGDAIDGHVVTRAVHDNGVNVVVQVRDAQGRRFALKTLHPSRAGDHAERATLAHEAWLARRLDGGPFARLHPHASPNAFYLLYEWLEGTTLAHALEQRGPLPIDELVGVARATLDAVARLHRQRVVHRDIKPANLFRGDDGVLRLLDLGVAVTGSEPAETRGLHAGTPAFINPEQWDGAPADAASDLFAVGVTLWQLATGRLPYGEVAPYQVARYRRDPAPPWHGRPDLPVWLGHVLLKAVARDPRQRFETAEEFLLAIERGAARPLTAPPATPLLARDPAGGLKIALAISLLANAALVGALLVLR